MTTLTAYVLLGALACALVLVLFSVRLRETAGPSDRPHVLTRFFLVALRLVIGWHFFIEAAEKLHDGSWSSEGYLRESTGPLAPTFRKLAGDRLIDQLTLNGDKLSDELELRWTTYLDEFTNFYHLNAEQRQQASTAMDQMKETAKLWLSTRQRNVRKITAAPDAPAVTVKWTMPQRLTEYTMLQDRIRYAEDNLLGRYGEEAEADWKTAKANAAKWRGGLKRDFDLLDKDMKRTLRTQLLGIAKQDLPVDYGTKLTDDLAKVAKKRKDDEDKKKLARPPDEEWDLVDTFQHKADEDVLNVYRNVFSELKQAGQENKLDDQTRRIVEYAIDKKQTPGNAYDILPYTPGRPLSSWTPLDVSDFAVKWGLLVVGLCLILGLLTRTACVVGALYLLLFYLAMPALPGWPSSPRAEGHYLFINKNIIEMIALLALATLRTGRWAGLDGLLGLLRRRRIEEVEPHSPRSEAPTLVKPVA